MTADLAAAVYGLIASFAYAAVFASVVTGFVLVAYLTLREVQHR